MPTDNTLKPPLKFSDASALDDTPVPADLLMGLSVDPVSGKLRNTKFSVQSIVDLADSGPGGPAADYVATETLGGIAAGDAFTTNDPTLVKLLRKYQAPGFNNSLRVDGQGSQDVPVGTQFAPAAKTFTWQTTNSANVAPNSLKLEDLTAGSTLTQSEANDGILNAAVVGFTAGRGLSRRYRLSGTNSQGGSFSTDLTITGHGQSAFGYSTSKGPFTVAQLLALSGVQLQDGKARTVAGVTAALGQYTVYAWDSPGTDDIAQVLQDGVDSIRGAFGAVRYAMGANGFGAQVTLAYLVSNADGAFTNSSLSFI